MAAIDRIVFNAQALKGTVKTCENVDENLMELSKPPVLSTVKQTYFYLKK